MNIDLLEELVRRKVRSLQKSGLARSEAIDLAGSQIMKSMEPGMGCASRFCMRMTLEGAKRRIIDESRSRELSESEKRSVVDSLHPERFKAA